MFKTEPQAGDRNALFLHTEMPLADAMMLGALLLAVAGMSAIG